MTKHIKIGAATCIDMIDAFNRKLEQLDPSYIDSSDNIYVDSSEDYDYIDEIYI